MIIKSWRLVKDIYVADAFSGKGAFDNGARWNSERVYAIYTAECLSLAILEVMVGGKTIELIQKRHFKIPAEFDDSLVETVRKLPTNWNTYPWVNETRQIGDEWIQSNRSVVLKVPSVVVQEEFTYIINPLHPDIKKVKIGKHEKVTIDTRLK